MRPPLAMRAIGGMVMTVVSVLGGVAVAPAVHASVEVALTGTYRVHSDGDWARRNEVRFKVPDDTQTWTADTVCVSPIECTGTVTSNLGWTGSARLDDYWYVEHEIPKWAPCPDGTFASGHQTFILVMWDPANEERKTNSNFLMGRNVTKTPSGACGRNQPLVFELPVSVERIS